MDALHNDCRDHCHEHHRHRQPVPHQPRIVGMKVIIRRTKRSEQDSGKYDHIRPAFALMHEGECLLPTCRREQEDNSPKTNDRKRQVGDDIPEIRNAEKTSFIGEMMVALGLRYPRQPKDCDNQEHCNYYENSYSSFLGDQLLPSRIQKTAHQAACKHKTLLFASAILSSKEIGRESVEPSGSAI